ncbi:hypothetical protein PF010_g14178 [Phytophthora fragariae]|uniref:CCHC-type domain-containing protein n=1 Tax=Phytophthora fragariae TaxID=53985 RepID=A0A6G0KXL2_9STRA|nr:hypothetical protein PF010_g14178 [Phytophthora fragariae]KAE9255551.1 hypothetical protein PF004_g523 [Phytophthora fragariae]
MWGATNKPPRYDTSGRPVLSGKASATEWWRAIPPGFELVPAGTQATKTGDSKVQTTIGGKPGKRPGGGDQNVKHRAKAFKVEGQHDVDVYGPRDQPDAAFETREGRLQRHRERLQQRAPRAPFVPRPGTKCHCCNMEGHFVRDCEVKKADLAEVYAQNGSGTST